MDDDVLTFEQLRNIRERERSEDTLQELDEDFFAKARDYLERKERTSRDGFGKEFVNIKHVVKDILDIRKKKILKLAFLSSKTSIAVDNLLPQEEPFFDNLKQELSAYKNRLDADVFGSGSEDSASVTDEETNPYREAEESGVAAAETADGSASHSENEDEADTDEEEVSEDAEGNAEAEQEEQPGSVDDVGEEDRSESDGGQDEEARTDQEDEGDGEVLFAGDDADSDDAQEFVSVTFTAAVDSFLGVDMESYGPFDEGDSAEIPVENAEAFVSKDKAEKD